MTIPLAPLPGELPLPTQPANAVSQEARDERWHAAIARLQQPGPGSGLVTRDDTAEEPASKAFENRVRTAFLATKGTTMAQWLASRETLMVQAARGELG